jgi:alginate O-acetyltransferase complex protein AlgI
MLFNSYQFIFLFLPLAVIGFYLFGSIKQRYGLYYLIAASMIFYGSWSPFYLLVLLCLLVVNAAFGSYLCSRHLRFRKSVRNLGIVLNLGVLGYFKYTYFIAENLTSDPRILAEFKDIILPLGISFFTFQKIAFLMDAEKGLVGEFKLSRFFLFVMFFPQLIAGPIVHHSEMFGQFKSPSFGRFSWRALAVGLTIFLLGLFKKTVLADNISPLADGLFAASMEGNTINLVCGWSGALAYTMQLYFDFSGYSDMAIGLGEMFGLRLPVNFDSPYKAGSIIEFWRRWHMTLSRFLRDYVYISLGGNRKGEPRRYLNLFLTMLIGGIWHGAGWTYVVWGMLHGLCLVINHAWRQFVTPRLALPTPPAAVAAGLSWLITFVVVVLAWVFFRAPTLAAASAVIEGMLGLHGVGTLEAAGVDALSQPRMGMRELALLPILLGIALLMPNVRELMGSAFPALKDDGQKRRSWIAQWQPDLRWAAVVAVAGGWAIIASSGISSFIYFQF